MKRKILIGIQARSTSTRLPNKALELLYNKNVLTWVINACKDSSKYLHKKFGYDAVVAILCPEGDPIAANYRMPIIEGDEHDVLSRYAKAYDFYKPDYICRITGDCPFLTGYNITSHILKCISCDYDYISNVDERCRTELDGKDIEVLSRKALLWLMDNANTPEEREHVTSKIRIDKPEELDRAHYLNRMDLSDIKLSIDTQEDLDRANARIASFFDKRNIAERDVGVDNVYYY